MSKFLDEIEEMYKDRERPELSLEEITIQQVNNFNNTGRKSEFGECSKCGNKGLIAYVDKNNRFAVKQCSCYRARESFRKLSNLGLGEFLKNINNIYDLPVQEQWQQSIKKRLIEFLNDKTYSTWLFLGGQVGCGKSTNIALVLNEILKDDNSLIIEWMNWESEYPTLAFGKNPDRLEELLDADILVIDDFLRHQDGKLTETERSVAKQIINDRYLFKKTTLITSELFIKEIIDLDEAIGTRILERCNRRFAVNILRDKNKNYRLNGTMDV